jgi:hypothetical protein
LPLPSGIKRLASLCRRRSAQRRDGRLEQPPPND